MDAGSAGPPPPGRLRPPTLRKNARQSRAVTEMYAETEAALERAKADVARLEREKTQLTQERNDLQNTIVRFNLERANYAGADAGPRGGGAVGGGSSLSLGAARGTGPP